MAIAAFSAHFWWRDLHSVRDSIVNQISSEALREQVGTFCCSFRVKCCDCTSIFLSLFIVKNVLRHVLMFDVNLSAVCYFRCSTYITYGIHDKTYAHLSLIHVSESFLIFVGE